MRDVGRFRPCFSRAQWLPSADEAVREKEIEQYCLDTLAEYEHPREVAFVEELPRTTTGVQEFELRERGAAEAAE